MIDSNSIDKTEIITDELDLIVVVKTLWNDRKFILLFIIIGVVVGVLISFLSPKQYTVSSVIVPQYSSKTTGSGLSALASMAGINIGGAESGSELSPLLYPQIVNSVPFQLELMNTPVHFQDVDHPVSVYEYYTELAKPNVFSTIKKYTIGLPGVIYSALNPPKEKQFIPVKLEGYNVLTLTEKQNTIYKMLSSAVLLDANAKEGYLTLSTTLSEPLLTAEIGQLAQELLQKYVIEFKTQKSKNELNFIQERYDAVKEEMERKQYNVATSIDKNKFLTSNTAQLGAARAQTNYQISNAVFLELAKQLEQAKIQVKKDTPTFTVIKPITIPIEPTGSGKLIKILISLLLFTFIAFSIILIRVQYPKIKELFKNQ